MKRFISFILAITAITAASAQNYDYKPRESWPFLLEHFTAGQVRTPGGNVLQEGMYNISVVDGKLHFINAGKIMAADMRQVQIVRIEDDIYVNRLGKMMKCIWEENGGKYLLLYTEVNMDKLAKTDIGYGISSATASSQKLNGLFGSQINVDLSTAIAQSLDGPVLPLTKTYCFLFGAREVPCEKNEFLALPGIDKAQAKAFLKEEKIKWHEPESLVKVLRYIVENTNL